MKEKKLKDSKAADRFIILIGLSMLVFGIFFMFTELSVTWHPSTDVKFGADFYTYVTRDAAIAASALVDLISMVKVGISAVFIFGGLLVISCQTRAMRIRKIDLAQQEEAPAPAAPYGTPAPAAYAPPVQPVQPVQPGFAPVPPQPQQGVPFGTPDSGVQ